MKKLLFILSLIFISFQAASQNALGDGALITRPVLDEAGRPIAFYNHYGVMYKGKVSHWDKNGLHYTSVDVFAKGQKVKVVHKGLQGKALEDFKKRYVSTIESYKKRDYDAVKNNCEHFAMELVWGIHRSIQSEQSIKAVNGYWKVIKAEILKKNPTSGGYLDLMDEYLKQNTPTETTIKPIENQIK